MGKGIRNWHESKYKNKGDQSFMQRNAGKRDKPTFSSPYFTDIYVFM